MKKAINHGYKQFISFNVKVWLQIEKSLQADFKV